MPSVRTGLSGWRYASWRGRFYPRGLPQRRELEHVASLFGTVELNGSFYSLQRPASYVSWREQTPPGFTFAVKGGRYITHMKRLRDVRTPLANFFASGVLALGDRLGPVLWQLPARTRLDLDVVGSFLDLLPTTTGAAAALAREHDDKLRDDAWTDVGPHGASQPIRHALEVRNPSFDDPAFTDLLRAHDVALVVSDGAGHWPVIDRPTASLVYVRLHGDTELYTSGYGDAAIDAWAGRVRRWYDGGHDVVVYFDNDAEVHAPFDALALTDRLSDVVTGPP